MSSKFKKKFTKAEPIVRIPFRPSYPPSAEQAEIFDVIECTDANVHIDASPGSGKTTTMVWAMTKEKREKGAALSMGKAISVELEPKCPPNVIVGTAHSFGRRAIATAFPGKYINVFNGKVQAIFKDLYPSLDPTKMEGKKKGEAYSFMFDLVQLINMLRVNLVDENNINEVERIAMQYSLDVNIDRVFGMLPQIYEKILEAPTNIDFTDMMWIPIRMNLPVPQFDMMYVDERQDLNSLMIEYVNRMTKGRIMTVGDERQSIYGFSGADLKSTERLIKRFGGRQLPLMTCYRCGKNIVYLAQTIYDTIQPFDKMHDGEVIHAEDIDYDMPDGSMILSRRNANLVKPCFALLRQGRKAIIKGKDIGEGMIRLIESLKASDATDLIDKVEAYREKRTEVLMRKEDATKSQVEKLNDEAQCIIEIASSCQTIADVEGKINIIFDESVNGITLSSIHRSKGLEADEVTIIDYSRVRLSHDKMTEEDHIQEKNLNFVAVTRAKNKLTLVG